MEIRIKETATSEVIPDSEYDFESEAIYKKVMQMYKETGKCPYCGISVEMDNKENNYVLDSGWYNDLKCRMCNMKPPIRQTIHYEITKKLLDEIN